MEVAPFFVDFHHFLSIFTILYQFSRFTHFWRDLHFVAIYALFPQIFLAKIAFSATSHAFCMYDFCVIHKQLINIPLVTSIESIFLTFDMMVSPSDVDENCQCIWDIKWSCVENNVIKVSIKIKVCRKQSAEFHKATIRNLYYLISQLVFIGPESDHWLCLSFTD